MWGFLLFIHSLLLFQEDVELLTDEGAGWRLGATLQLTATSTFCFVWVSKPCLENSFIKPSNQAEPFLWQGRTHGEHLPGVGSGVLWVPQLWAGWGLHGQLGKAPGWRFPSLNILIWGPGRPKLVLGGSGSHCWEQQLAVTTHSTQIYLTLLHFSCFHMDPLSKLWGRKVVQVENVMSLIFTLFL